MFFFLISILVLFYQPINISGNVIGVLDNFKLNILFAVILIILVIIFLRAGLEEIVEEGYPSVDEEDQYSEAIEEYKERNTPYYLKTKFPKVLYGAYKLLGKMKLGQVYGKNNLPKGPKLFILPHRDIGDSERLVASLDDTVHFFYGTRVQSAGIPAFAYLAGNIPIRESLSEYSPAEKEAIRNSSTFFKRGFRNMIDNEKKDTVKNLGNIRAMVSMLLRGESAAIYAEGPTLHYKEGGKKIFGGYSLVAREYERVTGEKLPIIPVGSSKGNMAFGNAYYLDESGKTSKKEIKEIARKKIDEMLDFLKRK